MKKEISEKQLVANRRNAQFSTGPRTENGKAASRWNAIKHGALARQVVVSGFLHQESTGDFKKLCREYQESLQPIGPLEEMLVSQIVATVWRLRRVRMAESGEIATNVDRHWWNPRQTPWEMGNGTKRNPLNGSLKDDVKTVAGIEYVIECLQELRAAIGKIGQLTQFELAEYKRYSQEPNEIIRHLNKSVQWLTSNPEKLPAEELRAHHLKDVLDYLDQQIAHYHELAAIRQEQMDAEDNIRRASAMLLPEEVLERIVRYESALQRQLYRSMNQLERLQRRRLGETVPPPVVMDVSLRS